MPVLVSQGCILSILRILVCMMFSKYGCGLTRGEIAPLLAHMSLGRYLIVDEG